MRQHIAILPDGRRLHLQDGPIDLIVEAFGETAEVRRAYAAAAARFATILDELCAELGVLRAPVENGSCPLAGTVASRMWRAARAFADDGFVTPMAAVAGAVAEEMLGSMIGAAPGLARAYVNDGGDIALHLSPGNELAAAMIDRPDRPARIGTATIRYDDPVRGIATSGRHGRSFSFGIADAVTVLAENASSADVAATLIANAVDLPGHRSIERVPANGLQPDSDLGPRPVTRAVPTLTEDEIGIALSNGIACAESFRARGLISGAALNLQGRTATLDLPDTAARLFASSEKKKAHG